MLARWSRWKKSTNEVLSETEHWRRRRRIDILLFVYVIWSYLSDALCQGPISQSLDACGARSSLFRLLIARSFARSSNCFCDVRIALAKVGVDILFLPSPNNSGSVLALTSNFDVCVDVCCPRYCQCSGQLSEPICERAEAYLNGKGIACVVAIRCRRRSAKNAA